MKKSLLLLIIILLTLSVPARAEQFAESIVLKLKNGETISFALNEQPKLTFSQGNLILSSSTYESTYKLSDLDGYQIKYSDTNSIQSIKEGEQVLRQEAGCIYISGLNPQTEVKVYSTSGVVVCSTIANTDGSATIDLSAQLPGVYVISYGANSIKITKR